MARARAAWWVPAVGACVLAYLALMTCADVFGPGALGIGLRFRQGEALVVETLDGFPAARAGVSRGDAIVTVDGLRVSNLFEWRIAGENFSVGRPARLELRRGGERREVELLFEPHWRRFTPGTWFALAAKLLAELVTIGLALLIALKRPRDAVALIGAIWLLGLAVTDLAPLATLDPHAPTLPNGADALWRSLPSWSLPPLWIGYATFLVGPLLMVVFFGLFPRPMFRTRRAWLLWGLTWAPLAIRGIPSLLLLQYRTLYDPDRGIGKLSPSTMPIVGLGVMAALATAVTLLVLSYRRTADINERRRIRVVVLGNVVGLAGTASVAMSGFLDLPQPLQGMLQSPGARVLASLLLLLLPISLAYGILRHRLLDVGTIVRQGLQYALARRVALSIVPACAVLLAVDLVVHGDQPLLAVVRSRGWIYLVVAAIAAVAYWQRQAWLDALDRSFFRERYDAQRLLAETVEEIRRATNLEDIAGRVVSRIESALHPEYVVVLSRGPRDTSYRLVAAAPALPPAFALTPDSKVVGLVRLLGRSVDTSAGDSGWLKEQLPHEETTALQQSRIGLIVPVTLQEAGPEALLVLGIKRSEEPYSREDVELVQAVAGSLALVAERPATSRGPTWTPAAPADVEATLQVEGFAECPRCGACQDSRTRVCEQDGARLEVVRLPRELAGRYRLIRRLGRGGMGTVYEAADLALERRVAVKVIREDLVGSAEAAERFRREARASASMTHRNVVTVHDFGLVAGTRGYLVMELLRGQTLRDLLRERGRLEPAAAIAILRPIADAVEAAHAQQLVHRDLKPENVFLVAEGQASALPQQASSPSVKVLDFGIARFLSGDQSTTTVVTDRPIGTLHYMGPEQLRGGQAERGWDTWALSVMAYEMLAGTLPFPSATAVDYQVAVLAARSLPISLALGPAFAALDVFFSRALSANAGERPPGALSLVQMLDEALGCSVHATR